MDINGLTSSTAPSTASSVPSATRPPRTDKDRDQDGGARQVKGGMHQLFSAVSQALGSLGLSLPAAGSQNTKSVSANADQNASSGNATDSRQALHSFMHSLFQTLKSAGTSQPATSATGTASAGEKDGGSQLTGNSAYSNDLATRLQSLAQSLSTQSTGAAPTVSSGTDKLASSFSNLVKALEQNGGTANTSPNTQGNQADLQSFLDKLSQNLQANGGAFSTLGVAINTVA